MGDRDQASRGRFCRRHRPAVRLYLVWPDQYTGHRQRQLGHLQHRPGSGSAGLDVRRIPRGDRPAIDIADATSSYADIINGQWSRRAGFPPATATGPCSRTSRHAGCMTAGISASGRISRFRSARPRPPNTVTTRAPSSKATIRSRKPSANGPSARRLSDQPVQLRQLLRQQLPELLAGGATTRTRSPRGSVSARSSATSSTVSMFTRRQPVGLYPQRRGRPVRSMFASSFRSDTRRQNSPLDRPATSGHGAPPWSGLIPAGFSRLASGTANCGSVSQGNRIQVSWLTSVMKLSTSALPAGLA